MNKKNNLEKLKEENKRLARALAICLNRPLIRQIRSSIKRMEKGKFIGEKEFFKESPLECCQ